ncbi:amino acid adenylation domain-containing protein [Rhodococcus ruber]|uniref:Amino acid adenylation domain-containing protein n=1 Tax=Rhodococcus ruber TaxID=1830 RepID=A0ABT4MJV7_9NOCA|nr:non-ribosomal peptide synthetase [Rhodococcus ruber]MCZ4521274.1 amino acid adenylation domain-containing protein [Rhodococcus ruber]
MSEDGSTGNSSETTGRAGGRPKRARPTRTRPTRTPMLPNLLAAAVEKNPQGIAVVDRDRSMTYSQLDAASSKLARVLIARDVGPEKFVALAVTRSIESLLTVWAVAKTGAAFVPIDPNYPAARVEHMVSDSGVQMGITVGEFESRLPGSVRWIVLDAPDTIAALGEESGDPIVAADRTGAIVPSNLAYVIYTSGSTGVPKGVAVSQAGLAPLTATLVEYYELDSRSRTLHFASPSFDASVLELLMAVGAGSTMVIVAPGVYGGSDLADVVRDGHVSHAFITPAALTSLDPEDVPDLRVLGVGGEAVSGELVSKWAPSRQLHNVYGPTETTIASNMSQPLIAGEPVVLGSSTQGMTYYVLDDRLRQVPSGVAGELYLTGPGVARGYHRRFGLTAARFVANPYATAGEANDARLYRTGDTVRWREGASGRTLEYIGRNDFQVQIRGFRVELGEIDAALESVGGIDFAVTVSRANAAGTMVLAAYVKATPGTDLNIGAVLDAVAVKLPAHMIPAVVTELDSIPLTPIGKLDRDALPEPVFEVVEYRAPITDTEHLVAEIFAELLGSDRVGLDDNFFENGGNSLVATQVVARLGSALGKRLPARMVFESPTVVALAKSADSAGRVLTGPTLGPRERPNSIPLSMAQQRMWFLNRFDPDSAANNVPVVLRISGELDEPALSAAVLDVISRHEVLRTVYPELDGVGHQVIRPVGEHDRSLFRSTASASETERSVLNFLSAGFDVTQEIPFRVGLFTVTDDGTHVLVLVAHHIAADGSSMAPLARDVMTAYAARVAGTAPSWAPLAVQYADYALWQRELLGSADDPRSLQSAQIAFWRERLAEIPDQIPLPTDRPRPSVWSSRGALVSFALNATQHAGIVRLAQANGATVFMVVHAALSVALARLTAEDDIAIGAPVAGRGEEVLDDVIGMFVNTVVLRAEIDRNESFGGLLGRLVGSDLSAFDHADVPFERLVEALDPPRSQGRHPLVQVALFFQNFARTSLQLPGLTVDEFGSAPVSAKFDLQFTLGEMQSSTGGSAGLHGEIIYATDLFDESTVQSFAQRFLSVVDAVVADDGVRVGDIEIVSAAERAALLEDWRGPTAELGPADELLLDGFDNHVESTPDATALVLGDTTLTYRELNSRVESVARGLVALGAGPESTVALAMRRSIELVVGMYAVLRAGAAYVPIDPEQPAERTGYIVETAQPLCVLTTRTDGFSAPDGTPALLIDELAAAGPSTGGGGVRRVVRGDNTAYVIFTSGSTGRPKGVAVSHRAIVNEMAWMQQQYSIASEDVYLQKTATTFDVSLWGFFLPLRVGATLVLTAPGAQREPAELANLIAETGATLTDFVPSMLSVFGESVTAGLLDTLREIFVIGEALPARAIEVFRTKSAARVHNLYGPTEAAVSITFADVTEHDTEEDSSVPIGVPQTNSEILVLDSRLRPVPAGVAGELYLAGTQLARGYVSRADLTSERFVAHAFASNGERMYRTGDLVRWSVADGVKGAGTLEYIGRTDFQVKFRGQRIELGDIESAMSTHPGVSSAVVVVAHGPAGDILVGYLVPSVGATVDVGEVTRTLSGALPGYMVPTALVVLDSLPLNPAGKLDRRMLPAPVFETTEYRAPTDDLEVTIAAVFGQVLGVDRVGLDDDFFGLGGNSLIATQLVSRLGAELGLRVSVRTVFETSTVESLAGAVRRLDRNERPVGPVATPRPEHLPLARSQERIWEANQLSQDALWNMPFALSVHGPFDVAALRAAVRDLVSRHESLRTVYPDSDRGPHQRILSIDSGLEPIEVVQVSTERLDSALDEFMWGSFDIRHEVPLRVRVFQTTPSDVVIAIVVQHMSADGYSLGIMSRHLVEAYVARSTGTAPEWEPEVIQYADYVLWDRKLMGDADDSSSEMHRQISYWLDKLDGIPDRYELPSSVTPPAVPSTRGSMSPVVIDAESHAGLVALSERTGASLYMVLHAALSLFIGRVSGQDDVVIATAVANRSTPDLEPIVGNFADDIAIRVDVHSDEEPDALIARVREELLSAFDHSSIGVAEIERALGLVGDDFRPLYQVILILQRALEVTATEQRDVDESIPTIVQIPVGNEYARHELEFSIRDSYDENGVPKGISGGVIYAVDYFDAASAAALVDGFVAVAKTWAREELARLG